MISESAERRPKATRIASSIAIGTVTSRNAGRRYGKTRADGRGGDAAVHHQLDQLQQAREQQDEGEDAEPQERTEPGSPGRRTDGGPSARRSAGRSLTDGSAPNNRRRARRVRRQRRRGCCSAQGVAIAAAAASRRAAARRRSSRWRVGAASASTRSTARRSIAPPARRTTRARSRRRRPYRYAELDAIAATPAAGCSSSTAIQDPRNLGAILRTARAAGVGGVVLPQDRSVGITSVVVGASAGLSLRAADRAGDEPRPSHGDAERGRVVGWLASFPRRGRSVYELPRDRAAGPRRRRGGRGAPPARPPDVRLRGDACRWRAGVESLNVSVATAIALYELCCVRPREAAKDAAGVLFLDSPHTRCYVVGASSTAVMVSLSPRSIGCRAPIVDRGGSLAGLNRSAASPSAGGAPM